MAKASSSAELRRGAFEEHLEKPKSTLDALKPFSREWERRRSAQSVRPWKDGGRKAAQLSRRTWKIE
jgi:hypothetical protein